MAYWIYKCNSKNLGHQRHYGNWSHFFEKTRTSPVHQWGSTAVVPELDQLEAGDTILCYQTDRNELVGVAEVVDMEPDEEFLCIMLKPKEEIGVKVRPLKQNDARIEGFAALQQGVIKTLYDISKSDAEYFLKKARQAMK